MLGQSLEDDLLDAGGLSQPLCVAAAALALEVVNEYEHLAARRGADEVLGAVAAEDPPVGLKQIKMWVRSASKSKPSLVSRPTLMPRSSLPSMSIVCS